MNKKYAIFDMDGTLVDSMGYWASLGREYLASRGITEDVDEVLERIVPMTMTDSAALFIEEFKLPGTPETVAAEMNHVMYDHYKKDIPLKPGVDVYLKTLKSRGVKMCVASATDKYLVEACLERLGIAEYFEFFLSCEEVGSGKDRPDVFWEAVRRLGSCPEETAVYEDAIFAARTAKTAGFYVTGVYDENAASHWNALKELADETICGWAAAEMEL